jgi:hypothetical protein
MKTLKLIAGLISAAVVAGCATVDTPSRNVPFAQQNAASFAQQGALSQQFAPDFRVAKINVSVPRTLVVSEANSYKPRGDIVWRGEAPGDRYAQVEALFQEAMARGAKSAQGNIPVVIDIELTRFHALTEKTRYSIGGVHEIEFILTIRNAQTGQVLRQPRKVQADITGYGGQAAIEAERRGETEKVRILAHLENLIRVELSTAQGYQNVKLGFFG